MLYREMGRTGDKLSVLGYGCMRFPQKNGRIDEERAERQILQAIDNGVNYFDTAYIYHNGKSEGFLGKVLSKGYRDKVRIATKLPIFIVHSVKDMEDILETQLKRLNTDHIDYYLLHSVTDKASLNKMKQLGVFDFLEKSKKDGKIVYRGFSYHGDCDDIKIILDDYGWDFCQIQYNYLDENNQAGRAGLEYAASKGIGVVAMEPLRGGKLVGRMPDEVRKIWDRAQIRRSPAEWAFRWVWNHPEVTVALSGMNEEEHISENIRIAGEAYPNSLKPEELKLVDSVKEVYQKLMKAGCTGCRYCMPCPAGVDIPQCLNLYNNKHLFEDNQTKFQYVFRTSGLVSGEPSYATLCKECGKCEKMCPQHLPIRKHLKEAGRELQPRAMKQIIWLARNVTRVYNMLKRRFI